MKNKFFTLNALIVTTLAFSIFSCGNKELSGTQDTALSDLQSGAIIDLGVVSGDLHQMSVTLTNASIMMDGLKSAALARSLVYINLFTNSNGILNEGTYTYSNSDNYSTFTFKSGLIYMPNAVSNNYDQFAMNTGIMSIIRDGITYHITLEGTFSDGKSFHGSFLGQLSYSDTSVTY